MNIQVNGVNLFYKKSGSGPPLLLLHGNGEDHHIFDKLSEKLGTTFTLYALDSRNHGASQQTDDYSYQTMMKDVHEFISKLQLRPVNVIGFSDGAIISLLLAMVHPEQLRKMALLGVNLSPEDFTEESLTEIRETYALTGDPLFKLMLEEPNISLDGVREVLVPALVVSGEFDAFKPESFRQLAAALPEARLMIVKGHDHGSYIIDADLLYQDFCNFFNM